MPEKFPGFKLQNPPESDPIKPNQAFEINPRRKGHNRLWSNWTNAAWRFLNGTQEHE
jgi:hypothetical protein